MNHPTKRYVRFVNGWPARPVETVRGRSEWRMLADILSLDPFQAVGS